MICLVIIFVLWGGGFFSLLELLIQRRKRVTASELSMSVLIFTIFIFTAMFWDLRSSTRRPLLRLLEKRRLQNVWNRIISLQDILILYLNIKIKPPTLLCCHILFASYLFFGFFCYLTLSSLNWHTTVGAEVAFFCLFFLFLFAHTETWWHKNWPIRNSFTTR